MVALSVINFKCIFPSVLMFGMVWKDNFTIVIIILFLMLAAPPSVSDVKIIGDLIEGNVIKGVGNYFGGREGPSKFDWLRESKDKAGLVTDLFFVET